jgi:AcrR family transcriptional regulator
VTRNRDDLRVTRTREAIRSRFLDLLLQKNFNDITVKDIAAAANIGRGTFYLHYLDKYDLLAKVVDCGLDETLHHFHPASYFKNGQIIPKRLIGFTTDIFKYFKENQRFFRAMLFNEGIPNFRSRMQQRFLQKFHHDISGDAVLAAAIDPMSMEILPIFISSGMIGLIAWWFGNGMRVPEAAMARKIYQIMTTGPLRTFGFSVNERSAER